MSRTYKDMPIRVRSKRKKEIDARRLARVVIALAQAEADDLENVKPTKGGRPKRPPTGEAA